MLNAVVDNRFEEAIQEAKDVDAFLRSTSLSVDQLEKEKPFLGVPFSNKESTAGKGLLKCCDFKNACSTLNSNPQKSMKSCVSW